MYMRHIPESLWKSPHEDFWVCQTASRTVRDKIAGVRCGCFVPDIKHVSLNVRLYMSICYVSIHSFQIIRFIKYILLYIRHFRPLAYCVFI